MEASPQLVEKLETLIEQNTRLITLLEKAHQPKSVWVNPDEACRLLGKNESSTGQHRRVLEWARKHGHLKTFGSLRPYTYLRKEVEDLLHKVETRRVFLP